MVKLPDETEFRASERVRHLSEAKSEAQDGDYDDIYSEYPSYEKTEYKSEPFPSDDIVEMHFGPRTEHNLKVDIFTDFDGFQISCDCDTSDSPYDCGCDSFHFATNTRGEYLVLAYSESEPEKFNTRKDAYAYMMERLLNDLKN